MTGIKVVLYDRDGEVERVEAEQLDEALVERVADFTRDGEHYARVVAAEEER